MAFLFLAPYRRKRLRAGRCGPVILTRKANKELLMNKKKTILIVFIFIVLCIAGMASASAEDPAPSADADLSREVAGLKSKITCLEEKIGEKDNKSLFQSAISGIGIAGGISGGLFYASNPGPEASDNEFLLSNFLVELSSKDNTTPVEVVGAFGETSTPSVLDSPETNKNLDIEQYPHLGRHRLQSASRRCPLDVGLSHLQ